MFWAVLVAPAFLIWVAIVFLPWRPWRTSESLDSEADSSSVDLNQLTVLIPARNEARLLPRTLSALQQQGEGLKIVLIDDQSTDGTAAVASDTKIPNLEIVTGAPLPEGWSGKLWALEQGWKKTNTPFVLLLDADIELKPGILAKLFEKMRREQIQFVSLMVSFQMQTFWERVLLPSFIYYFKLLYPFSCSNNPRNRRVAAAAGGCILMESKVLKDLGGFVSIRDALIDDCTLAKRVKLGGNKTWIGLTHSAHSIRPSHQFGTIFHMIARSAFTQLHYSTWALLGLSVLLVAMYWAPCVAIFSGNQIAILLGSAALAMMMLSYAPTLKYYELSMYWILVMPLAGTIFLAATWYSAVRYWCGHRSVWKGRLYTKTSSRN
jgi:hopene-associated glycosyltransferase HpnB